MSRYRKVLTRIWEDDKFPHLPRDTQRLFLYHLTSPRSTPFLLYVEGLGAMGDALKLTRAQLNRAVADLADADLAWYANDGSNLVFLPNGLRIRENAPESENAIITWINLVLELPKGPFLTRCVEHWRSLGASIGHKFSAAFVSQVITVALTDGIADGIPDAPRTVTGTGAGTGAVTGTGAGIPTPAGQGSGRPHPIKAVLEEYDRLFTARFGERPVILGGKDAANVKRLLGTRSPAEIKTLLAQFFASDDEWIQGSGYTVGAFVVSVNKLLAQAARQPRLFTPKTAGNAAAVRAFVERGQ